MTTLIIILLVLMALAIGALTNAYLTIFQRRAIECGAFICFAVALAALTSFA